MKQHKHDMDYEFPEGRYPRGFRGDSWCKTCGERWYRPEAIRMEMFGLIRNPNPPGSNDKDMRTADSAMFRVEDIKLQTSDTLQDN